MKKKYVIAIISTILAVLVCILLWLVFHNPIQIIEWNKNATNQNITIKIKEIRNGLYSFNDSEFQDNTTIIIDENQALKIKVKNWLGITFEKNVNISNIDKALPILTEIKTNYAETKTNVSFEIFASDKESGIKEYIFIVDEKEIISKDSKFIIPEIKKSLVIKIRDEAGNELLVDEAFYNKKNGEISVVKNVKTITNQNVILTIIKENDDEEYSFSKDDKENYSKNNIYEVTENGTVWIKVKQNNKVLNTKIIVDNIDKEKPSIQYKKDISTKQITITLEGKDNYSKHLVYQFGKEEWSIETKKTFKENLKNYYIKVKDEAGNESYLVLNENLLKESNPSDKTEESKPENSKPKPETPIPEEIPIEFTYTYNKESTKEVILNIQTNSDYEISYNFSAWTKEKTIKITDNKSDYSIRVRNSKGTIKEVKIAITNIVKEKTIAEKNQDTINQIYQTYGFKIAYGESSGTTWYNGKPCVILNNHEKAMEALKEIQSSLTIFPKNFFRNFIGQNGYRIMLFDDLTGSANGFASYEFGDDNFVSLDVNAAFVGRVMYHETFHIMENFIKQKSYGKPNPFANWTKLNPSGFSYSSSSDNTYTTLDLNRYQTNPNEISFMSQYAKTSEVEDRAEVFTDLMFRAFRKNYMENGFGVNEKAKSLAFIIRDYFPNSKGAAWERWIRW